MSRYTVPSTANNGSSGAVSTSASALVSSVFCYGEAVSASSRRPSFDTGIGTAVTSSYTPAKLNSRTPGDSGDYAQSTLGTITPTIQFAGGGFSQYAWRAHPLRTICGYNLTWSWTTAPDDCVVIFSEDQSEVTRRRLSRRTTKPGFFAQMGNTINNFQKTGGGAYQIHGPVFHNDITWLDPWPWRNGMAQSDFWNINILNPRRRVNVT